MKRCHGIRSLKLPVVLMLLVGMSMGVAADPDIPKRLVLANGEWEPYQSADLQHYGVVSRITRAAFERVGIDVEYEFLPWKRAYVMASNGTLAGTVAWRKSEERLAEFWFSDPIFQSRTVFFYHNKQTFDWESLQGLDGAVIGQTLGYQYVPLERAARRGWVKLQEAATDLLNFRKLLHRRIDLFPSELNVGLHLLNTEFSAEERARINWHPRPLETVDYHLMISRRIPYGKAIISRFNAGLEQLAEEGLVKQWFEESRSGEYQVASP